MIRLLLISLISAALFSLTACSDENKTESHNTESHAENKKHKDDEHHGAKKEQAHDDLDNHKDDEHHGAKEEQAHDDHDKHKDGEHHNEKESDHKEESGGHDEEAGSVHLNADQMKMANIVVKALQLSDAAITVRAPGEIKLNAYRTIKVSPRINAQIIKRHAKLGDEVNEGQSLVTLSSVEMAEAQGQLLLADKEWKRVKKLGRKVVSARRFLTAKIEYEKSYASAKAYGMNQKEINLLLAQKRSADGSFHLVAKQAGRILHDKFIVGEYVEAGYELMVIADEATMWVEARVTPEIAGQIKIGSNAEIMTDKMRLTAKVIQLHHTLDETTRTSAVRLEVDNKDDRLHAGMFVSTLISTSNQSKALQLPEAAVLRSSDGDWQIFVEQDEVGEFKAVEVEVKQFSDGSAIIEGIQPGTRIVTQGAFFVQSELAKGGFEIHNH